MGEEVMRGSAGETERLRTTKVRAGITLLLVLCAALLAEGAPPQRRDPRLDLRRAISSGNIPRLRELISQGVNVDQPNVFIERFALHGAIEYGNVEVVAFLLSAGADIQRKARLLGEETVATPLHFAVYHSYSLFTGIIRSFEGGSPIVRLLISKGADVNALDSDGSTPLHRAIGMYDGEPGIACQLIRAGADLKIKDRKGRTPWELLFAGQECGLSGPARLRVISLMLSKGSKFGIPVFDLAAGGETEKLKDLLEKDASLVDVKGPGRARPLCWAALMGHEGSAKLLLQKGAAKAEHFIDPLCCAAVGGHETIAGQIISNGPKYRGPKGARYKDEALRWAAVCGQANMCKFLINKGANVNARDVLEDAIRGGSTQTVKVLLEAGAKVKTEKGSEDSILFEPVRRGHVGIVKLLLERGVNPNRKDPIGNTPLHEAARWGRLLIARALLDSGAAINARGSSGFTPLHRAIRTHHYSPQMVKLLIDRGADVRATAKYGWSVLRSAKQSDRRDSIRLIEGILSKQEKRSK